MAAHHEVHFEQYITEQLVNNGWKEGHSCHYARCHGLGKGHPARCLAQTE